ncbi:MAG TPA: hypothetical protein VMC80_01170 [Patescibacteria group bacterium]|nr:hypothetical protein [Patescibacteria group bacterium]
MKKKGMADIIVTVLLIGLVLALGSIVWVVVSNLTNKNLQSTQSCFGNYGEISLNNQYTCYNTNTKELNFSIIIGDVSVDKVVISISGAGIIKSYSIPGTYPNAKMFGASSYGGALVLPNKSEGLTYVTKDFQSIPDTIKIAPVINGQQCDYSDTLSQIDTC